MNFFAHPPRKNTGNAVAGLRRTSFRIPALLKWMVVAAIAGAVTFSCFVGNMGLAAMGNAYRLNGAMVGATLGTLGVAVLWSAFYKKRN